MLLPAPLATRSCNDRYLREAEVPSSLALASWETTGSLLPSD
jgi:hypothetical protein